MAAHVPAWLPGGTFWVFATGAVFVGTTILAITGRKSAFGYGALGVLLLAFIFLIHLPTWFAEHGMVFRTAMMNLLKDVSLLGGALVGLGAEIQPRENRSILADS